MTLAQCGTAEDSFGTGQINLELPGGLNLRTIGAVFRTYLDEIGLSWGHLR